MNDAVADDDAEALGIPVLLAERIDDAATNVIVVGCGIGDLAGKACDSYDTNLSGADTKYSHLNPVSSELAKVRTLTTESWAFAYQPNQTRMKNR